MEGGGRDGGTGSDMGPVMAGLRAAGGGGVGVTGNPLFRHAARRHPRRLRAAPGAYRPRAIGRRGRGAAHPW